MFDALKQRHNSVPAKSKWLRTLLRHRENSLENSLTDQLDNFDTSPNMQARDGLRQSSACPIEGSGAGVGLPIELLLKIFKDVAPLDTLRCRVVCRRFKQFIDELPEIQYKIELYVADFVNNEANTSMNTSTRLEALISHQHSWKSPSHYYVWKPVNVEQFGSLGQPGLYKYSDNVWTRHRTQPPVLDAWGHETANDKLECLSLEDAADGALEIRYWTVKFSFKFSKYVADPARGVFYLLQFSSEGESPHLRLWTVAMADDRVLADRLIDSVDIHAGSLSPCVYYAHNFLLAFNFRFDVGPDSTPVDIILLDARSGELLDTYVKVLPRHQRGRMLPSPFLSKNIFLLHIMEDGQYITELYTLVPVGAERRPKICHTATFKYPEVRQEYAKYWRMPAPLWKDDSQCQGTQFTRDSGSPPFLHSTNVPLTVVSRWYRDIFILHCIPTSMFESISRQVHGSQHPYSEWSGDARIIPWESWGPQHTRCFVNRNLSCRHTTYGHQVLLQDLTLLDFNQLDIARDLHRVGESKTSHGTLLGSFWKNNSKNKYSAKDVHIPGTTGRIVSKPTVIPRGKIFVHDVVTTLPYRETKLDWTGPEPAILCGGRTWTMILRRNIQTPDTENEAYRLMRR